MRYEEAGMCRQHWVATTGEIGEINFNASYTILMNNATGLEIMPGVQGALNDVNIMAVTSNEATVDTNGDGQIWVGNESMLKHRTLGTIQPQHRGLCR